MRGTKTKRWVNLAMQVLPENDNGISYKLVDEAISVIAASGYVYKVCPFETVVECTLDQAFDLIQDIHDACAVAGALRMFTNLKIEVDFGRDVKIADKIGKYQ